MTAAPSARPKALLFDVYGTCVDWRTAIVAAGRALGHELGRDDVDWEAFADLWRAKYVEGLAANPRRERHSGWRTLDVLHREALDEVLSDLGLDGIPATRLTELNDTWRRADPWPDVPSGLARLRESHVVAPLSNGHIALQVELARHGGLTWDAIVGAEIAWAYKPQPEAFLRSVEALGLLPAEAMLVTAHNVDGRNARRLGLRTALVIRSTQFGPGQTTDLEDEHGADFVAHDLHDLDTQLCRAYGERAIPA
ncbi:haloacid dehalogenase type II [Capillimicrobium parvum]|uniref:(S)-2-haloacid dehalogenase n=1 Tax=Capillimicrobium parvum TaxID=2884022 RepID=A0A9E7BW41_9ACTN|nr:haloacid dehalogenase type II [Capillimicrobium parvum]UGS33675.1 (S)-2-haloacid dehalogenase [Capillimicrobium parvum]